MDEGCGFPQRGDVDRDLGGVVLFPAAPEAESVTVDPIVTAQQVHERALVLDAHADIEIPGKPSRYTGPDGLSKVAPEKMRAGGVDVVVMAIAVGPRPARRARLCRGACHGCR
ncbi:MAG: hypothetical protein HC809_16290 [Gammaproteobacteria bacterium]|nr:hypothetical protein [Gammaproteobacteria bacterium]